MEKTDPLIDYVNRHFAPEDEALQRADQGSAAKGLPQIAIEPMEGRLLQLLVRIAGARRAVEFGTLGGYSAIWIARGLPPDGRLITLEHSPHHAQVAREHLAAAGLADRVEVREGEALDQLDALAAEGPFDFVFIDADKASYIQYYDWAVENVRPGGVITAHNATGTTDSPNLVAPPEKSDYARYLAAFNAHVAADRRVDATIIPSGQGTLIAVRREAQT